MAAIVASKMKHERRLRESRSFPDSKNMERRRSSPSNLSNLHEDETFKSCQKQVEHLQKIPFQILNIMIGEIFKFERQQA
jgi:hypothetical protein